MEYISLACDVLSAIEKTMDDEYFNVKDFTAERFGVSDWLYCHLLDDLNENGYIGGVDMEHPYLTLKGAEFLVRHRPDVWMDA